MTTTTKRPEEIIKGIDPVSVNLLRQIYAALKDRSVENLDFLERCWVAGIERTYTNKQDFDHNLMESILSQATEILNEDIKWDSKRERFYTVLEKIVFLKAREDVFKEFFDNVEASISAAMQLDFSKKIPLTNIVSNEKANILNYAATMLNMLLETMEYSVVSTKAVNAALSAIPGIVTIVTDKKGNIRFISDLGERILGVQHNDMIGMPIGEVIENFSVIEEKLKEKGFVRRTKIRIQMNGQESVPAILNVPKLYKNWKEIEEVVYTLKFSSTQKTQVKESNNLIQS